jgi:hypothetical protein
MAGSAGIILPGQTAAATTTPASGYANLFMQTGGNPGPLPAFKDSNGNTHSLATSTGGGTYNVQDYGVLPSNVAATNNTNLATLLTTAPTYSIIYFPPGTYQFASAIAIGASAFRFQGGGQNATIIQTTSATADIFTLTDANWYTEFWDMTFSTSVTKTAGNAITTGTASGSGNVGINVRRCTFSGSSATNTLFNGVVYAGTNSGNITVVEDCSFSNWSNYGVYIEGNTSTPTSVANIQICNLVMNGTISSGNAVAGIYFLQCGSAQVLNCDVIACQSNLLLGGSSATSSGVFSVDCANCYFDDSAGPCLLFQGTCNIERCCFTQCWFTTGTQTTGASAIQSTNTSTIGLTGCVFDLCQVYNTYGTTGTTNGFNLTGCKDITIINGMVAGWTNGIAITPYSAANYTTVRIVNNTIGPVGNIGANGNGISLNAGSFAYNDILIADNNLDNNSIFPLVNSASGWTSLVVPAQPGMANPSLPSVTASAAINTTATYITPSTPIPAGALQVGTTYRITVTGICTSTAANLSTFVLRIGTAGTTADTAVANIVATSPASGTNIAFTAVFNITIRTIGSGGTCWGSGYIVNNGTTGISNNGVGGGASTAAVAVNTLVKNFVGVSYSSAATTTTCTFEQAFVEVVKA